MIRKLAEIGEISPQNLPKIELKNSDRDFCTLLSTIEEGFPEIRHLIKEAVKKDMEKIYTEFTYLRNLTIIIPL